MSNISGQLIKDSYNYVLQSDLISGIVYRIGGSIAENPKFVSGLTVNASFTYSDGTEFPGYVLTCDAAGNAVWSPVSGATSGVVVTGGTFDYSAGTLTLVLSNGVNVPISGLQDIYVTGGTVSGNTIVFTYNDTNTFEVSGITSFDTFTSYTASTEQILNSKVDTSTFNQFAQDTNISLNQRLEISSFTAYTATTQPLILNAVTGGTYSGGTLFLKNNSGTTIPITGFTDYVDDNFVHITGDTMTGRLNVPTLSAQTITATTIENVQYVDFTVNTPNPSVSGGRVFFNQDEQSLSYYSYLNNPVVVNTGQQLYLRVFNNTASAITKGSVVTIISQSNGLPAITLSVNSSTGTTGLVAGLAAETIPSGSSGLTITNGILSDLNIPSTYTPGDTIYLDYDDPGQFSNAVPNFPLSARTNEIGYIIQTGTTTGKVYVNINNENIQLSLTDLERNVLEGNVISTGIFAFSGLSLVSASGTTFNIAPVQAWFVENTSNYLKPTVEYITYSGQSNVPAIYVNTATQTYILLTPSGTILQQTSFPTPQQRRENVYLGKLGHANKTFLINAFNEPDFDVSPLSQLRDMFTPIRLINGGIYPSANGANLSFNTSAGVLYGLGIGWVLNTLNPDSISVSGTSPCTFQYRTQTGGTASNTTLINPTVYDNLGVLTAVGGGSNSSTNQRIYLVQNGQFRLQYGQKVYSTLADAVSNAQNEEFTTFSNFRDNAILIAILSVNKNATNLSDTTQAKFLLVSKFGETVGASGGISTTNLQQAYDNSVEPEIVINSTLDGVSIKNGTGNADNVSQLLQGINSGGTVTSFIRADGAISGSTIYGNGSGLTHVFNSVKINGTTQFSAGTDTFINFSGINVTISSGANNTIIFSAGTGGGGSGSGTSITGGAFTYTGNTFSGGTLTLTDSNGTPIPISGLRDTFVTGGTYNGSQITFTNNSGSTFVVSGLTATGFSANYYGSFSDSTNQPLSGANTPTVWKYNTTELSNGITVVDNTKITVANTGVYEIGYSPQIEKTQGAGAIVTIWAAINGNPVARSSSTLGLVSNSVLQLPFVSFIFELNANDYVEFYFSSDNEFVQLTALSGLTTPTRPDSPSVIIVAKQVGLSITAGATGDTFVTGFSLNNNTITLSQNRVDQYSAFTISLSAYTGNTSVSGNYLPLSGGTVTGATNFTSGLTADTISATTYQNLPTDISTTGATYFNNNFTFTNNTGGTYSVLFNTVTGLTVNGNLTADTISATTYLNLPTDVSVTGGTYSNGNTTFRNNTGGTFTVTGSATYSSGILSGSSNWVSNGNGSVNLPAVQVALYNNSSYTEPVQVYTVSSGVTGSGGIAALTNNDTNYIYIEYNNGSPRWGVSTDNSFINGSDVDLCYLIYRADNFVHVLDFGNEGAGLPNKISNRIVAVNRFGRESGFSLGLSGVTGVVTLTSGVAWNGTNRQSLVAVNSQDDIFFKSFHSGGTWVYTTTGDTINNTYYDDGTDIVSGTTSKYLVNWYFRGQEVNDHLYEVYGTDEYDSVAEAQLSIEPSLPELITSHAFLTGRIIVQVGATTGLVESAFVQVFQSTQVTQHNDLTSIQGGTAGQYYHLTASEYSNNAYTNVDNNFSVGQTISGGLIADTVSATTYQNLPISGLTEGSNISITGSNGNFTVSFTGTTGSNFTGNTSASCVNDFYVSNIFGCSGITTLQTSIQTNGSTVNGTLSHAEGISTSVGTVLAYSGTVVSGLISLDPIYGDLTGEFISGDYLFLDDSQFDDIYGKGNFLIDTVNYTTQTDIQLVDTSVTSTTVYVVSTVDLQFWIGDKTIYSNYSHAEGAGNVTINNYSHSEGRFSISFGVGSHAEGYSTKTIGIYSHSEGNSTFSIGDYSHAEGEAVKSVGNYSHAEGQNSISTGEHSHAEGRGTQSIGVFSHSEGNMSQAIGGFSHAEGNDTKAIGDYSHTMGYGTEAQRDYQLAIGEFNTTGNTDSLFVIGNGTGVGSRSDLALFNSNGIKFNVPLTATSISATTYQNLPLTITSVTESANVITVVNSNGSSTNSTIDAVTGGTYSAGQITLSGTGNVNGTQISTKILPVALTVVSNTASTDASLSSTFTLTLTGNTTLATPTNGFSGQRILYQLKQDGTGSKLLTLSSGFRSGPITVTLSTASNTTDYLGVIYNAIDDKWDVLALNKGYS